MGYLESIRVGTLVRQLDGNYCHSLSIKTHTVLTSVTTISSS